MQASKLRDQRQMRWHPQMIRWCLYLKLRSAGGYDVLRQSGILKLPSERTLRDYTHHIPPSTGFQEEVFEKLKGDAKLDELEEWQKFVAVCFDEMKIKEGLVFDKHSDHLIGFVALDDITNHLLQFERQCQSTTCTPAPALASHMLLLFVRGAFINLNFPLCQFPSQGASSYQLYPIVTEAIMRLEIHGFKVISLTSNGASSNRKLYRMMHVNDPKTPDPKQLKTTRKATRKAKCKTTLKSLKTTQHPKTIAYKMPNSYTHEDRQIFFITDVPHLLKTARNCWANSFAHSWKRTLWVCMLHKNIYKDYNVHFILFFYVVSYTEQWQIHQLEAHGQSI